MNYELVSNPCDFKNKTLRETIQPVDAMVPESLCPEFLYLAVFNADVYFPTSEKYRALLKEHLDNDMLVDCVTTQIPASEFGFGTEDYYVTVRTWIVTNETTATDPTSAMVVTIIHVDEPSEVRV